MPIQWTDTVLNAQAAGTWDQPNQVRVHTDDPGVAGTSNLIASSETTLTWSSAGAEGPLGAALQPATPGRSYAAPTVSLADDGEWLSFWRSGTFQGRVQCPQTATAGTYQPNLALVA
jgi:hypothetical protein